MKLLKKNSGKLEHKGSAWWRNSRAVGLALSIHLTPRRKGDIERPKSGVRHVIPNMGHYEEK